MQQGDRVLASNRLYGRTSQLLHQEFHRFGVLTTFVDTNDLHQVEQALRQPARLVLVETLSNPLLRLADLPALARLAHDAGGLLVVDNTFATPVLARPLEMGADLVMESLTKLIGGHSDVTLGLVCGRGDLLPELMQAASIWGLSANPFDCWLAERGWRRWPSACARHRRTRRRWRTGWPSSREWRACSIRAGATIPTTTWPAACCRGDSATCCASTWRAAGRRSTASCAAPGHPLQPVAGPHHDDVQPSGDDVAPLRQPGREDAAGHHGWIDPPVGRRGRIAGDPVGDEQGPAVIW